MNIQPTNFTGYIKDRNTYINTNQINSFSENKENKMPVCELKLNNGNKITIPTSGNTLYDAIKHAESTNLLVDIHKHELNLLG